MTRHESALWHHVHKSNAALGEPLATIFADRAVTSYRTGQSGNLRAALIGLALGVVLLPVKWVWMAMGVLP